MLSIDDLYKEGADGGDAAVKDNFAADDNDCESEYSKQSYDSTDLLEATVNEVNWADIEQSNAKGVSRGLFPDFKSKHGFNF